MKILILIAVMASAWPVHAASPPIPATGLLSSALGVPLSTEARTQLRESLKVHPGCDLLYLPLLKEREAQAFQEYAAKAGQDSLMLLYLLREGETYRPQLEAVHWAPMEILKRLLWINPNAPREDLCPEGIRPTRVVLDGYTDEVAEECYSATLGYHFGDVPQTVTLTFCGLMDKEGGMQELPALMKKYGIPLLHRRIIERKPAGKERPMKLKPISK
jgi:hypothetical protein